MDTKKFKEAKEVKLINAETNQELIRHKGIVDVEDPNRIFDVVGMGYKIAQHNEVAEVVVKSLDDLGFKNESKITEIDEGARIHINIQFPELKIDVLGTGDYVTMRASLDNSYNSTTGLRLDVGAIKRDVYIYVGERFTHYYHRHTQGLLINNLEDSIRKGIETFQTKIKAEFESLAATKVDPLVASGWLNDCIEKKTIPIKYLEQIKATFDLNRSNINNLWSLYNVVCEVVSAESESIDRRKQLSQTMLSAMKKTFKAN